MKITSVTAGATANNENVPYTRNPFYLFSGLGQGQKSCDPSGSLDHCGQHWSKSFIPGSCLKHTLQQMAWDDGRAFCQKENADLPMAHFPLKALDVEC
ncbi:hypothetical protein PoB_002212500 [Plakobranchus ocellatus]|uniref:C-type lectin domain-containing protein n=1 Tax=Plakobranchus ocellatus TaxID=259542 RepID=A0AAV3ZM46_9GAST|nr:hypothetical protein PoB_002212500 [Plakobranchus ocellatus]